MLAEGETGQQGDDLVSADTSAGILSRQKYPTAVFYEWGDAMGCVLVQVKLLSASTLGAWSMSRHVLNLHTSLSTESIDVLLVLHNISCDNILLLQVCM